MDFINEIKYKFLWWKNIYVKVFIYLEVVVKCWWVMRDKDLKVFEFVEDFLGELFLVIKGEWI